MTLEEARERCDRYLTILRYRRFLGSFEKKIRSRLMDMKNKLFFDEEEGAEEVDSHIAHSLEQSWEDLRDLGLIETRRRAG